METKILIPHSLKSNHLLSFYQGMKKFTLYTIKNTPPFPHAVLGKKNIYLVSIFHIQIGTLNLKEQNVYFHFLI